MASPSRTSTAIPSYHVTASLPGNAAQTVQDGGGSVRIAKSRTRKRILQSLQRISSSPSLAKLNRATSSATGDYQAGGKASVSCISLASSSLRSRYYFSFSQSTLQANLVNGKATAVQLDTSSQTVCSTFDPESPPLDEACASSLVCEAEALISSETEKEKLSLGIVDARQRQSYRAWTDLPPELVIKILGYLDPLELISCSSVSQVWRKMSYDGQLWSTIDTEAYYQRLPATALATLVKMAGPFLRNANLRGCIYDPPSTETLDSPSVYHDCNNITILTLAGCQISLNSLHGLLETNPRLKELDLSALDIVCDKTMSIVAANCPELEKLDVSWCTQLKTKSLLNLPLICHRLKDLRIRGLQGIEGLYDLMLALFETNLLETLFLSQCQDLDDRAIQYLVQGVSPSINALPRKATVPPRRLRNLKLNDCKGLTTTGLLVFAGQLPALELLDLSSCLGIKDEALIGLFQTCPNLRQIELEDLYELTNASLLALANSACASTLNHLNLSYCEQLGDPGMLAVVKSCPRLTHLTLDNTRVSDLLLIELAYTERPSFDATDLAAPYKSTAPDLKMVVYDCQHVTWAGIREILLHNTQPTPHNTIFLKCFFGYQATVNEHQRRVSRGDRLGAIRLETKWAQHMLANAEAEAQGAGSRRRRRRLREAAMLSAHEQTGSAPIVLDVNNAIVEFDASVMSFGRRRARSGGCVIM